MVHPVYVRDDDLTGEIEAFITKFKLPTPLARDVRRHARSLEEGRVPVVGTTQITATRVGASNVWNVLVETRNAANERVRQGGETIALSTTAGTLSAVWDQGDGTYTAALTTTANATVSGTLNGAAITDTATVVV